MGVGEMEVVRKNGCRFTIHKRSIAELTPKEGHVFLSFLQSRNIYIAFTY